MEASRRNFMTGTVAAMGLGAALLRGSAARADEPRRKPAWAREPAEPGVPGKDYKPVVTPNGETLPFKVVAGAKVFHLVAEEVDHEFLGGLRARCWGFNGRVHGPTIEAVAGDLCRIYVTNRLPVPTSIHWHGMLIPNGMDGVAGLTQPEIPSNQTFKYEFIVPEPGTFMYHSHHNEMTQIALGLMGMFVVHPRENKRPVDRDYAILLSEWRIDAGAYRPNPMEMTDFNIFTMNARAFPGTQPLVAKTGDKVRIRFGNLSPMDHHPIHIHGHAFKVTDTDGGPIPEAGQWPETMLLVPVGSTRTVEFIADNPGDWFLHCHMTHHMMNQMGHDIPNFVGVDLGDFDKRMQQLVPGYMTMGSEDMSGMHMPMPPNTVAMLNAKGQFGEITMGGMSTIIKVRDELKEGEDPGWYAHPKGTVAHAATPEEMKRDGIKVPSSAIKKTPNDHHHHSHD